MREIKFRVWNLKSKNWLNSENKYAISLNGELQENHYFCDENCGDEYGFCEDRWTDSKENVLIQEFSGVKDYNGNDIYDGDIIRTNAGRPYQNDWEVIFRDGGFSLIDAERDGDDFGVFTHSWHFEHGANPTIVGNIFENPELILFKK